MDRFYDMGANKLALAGIDDAGEMSPWYVLNEIGLYTYSPADYEYIILFPLFDKDELSIGDNKHFIIRKEDNGKKIIDITYGGEKVDGWFISHRN